MNLALELPEAATLPRLPGFAWRFFMQPVTLHRHLTACGVPRPGASLPGLWWRAADKAQAARYLGLLAGLLLYVMPLLSLACWLGLARIAPLWGIHLSTGDWLLGSALGLLLGGVLGLTLSVAGGVATGLAFGMAGSVLARLAVTQSPEPELLLLACLGLGAALGLADSAAYALARGRARRLRAVLAAALLLGGGVSLLLHLLSAPPDWARLAGHVRALDFPVLGHHALAFAGGYLALALRLPLYPLELAAQVLGWLGQRLLRLPGLRLAPVLYHDLGYLPYPWLAAQIVHAAPRRPELARRVLYASLLSPGQQGAAQAALARLQAAELHGLLKEKRLREIVALQGAWLPGVASAPPSLLAMREAARYVDAALLARFPHYRLQHLRGAEQAVASLRRELGGDASALARALEPQVRLWQKLIGRLRGAAEAKIMYQIPNPFHAGEPLTPERGREVFKGRADLIGQLESLLGDPRKSVSIALLGPRRCGKTSLLYMLPALLPEDLWIFFDLQDNPIDSPDAFFRALVRRAQEQARQERQMELPPLPPGEPLEAAARWLEAVDALAGERRIVLCFDEFERFASVFRGDPHRLGQLLGLFRATIQHRRRLRLLVCGVAPFNELDAVWTDHFINVREVRVGHLPYAAALELLTHPVPEFPPGTLPKAVADQVYRRTGGQPYLLQLYGSYLVQLLNEQGRRQAEPQDVQTVEERVLDEGTYYFRNTLQAAPPPVQAILQSLAHGATPPIDKPARQWLQRRLLLDKQQRIAIPVLARWIQIYW